MIDLPNYGHLVRVEQRAWDRYLRRGASGVSRRLVGQAFRLWLRLRRATMGLVDD